MAYLNANIPVTYAQIRREYLYDLQKHHGEVEDCIIFGLSAITGRSILFHAIMENGAIFYTAMEHPLSDTEVNIITKTIPELQLIKSTFRNFFRLKTSLDEGTNR